MRTLETQTLHRGVAGARHAFLPLPPGSADKLEVLVQVRTSPKALQAGSNLGRVHRKGWGHVCTERRQGGAGPVVFPWGASQPPPSCQHSISAHALSNWVAWS